MTTKSHLRSRRRSLDLLDTCAVGQRQATVEILREGSSSEKLLEVPDNALFFANGLLSVVLDKIPPERPIACKEGCSWCCVIVVQTTIPEVLRIARHLRQSFTGNRLADLLRRIDEALSQRQRGRRVPCPLLTGDRCGVYSMRPLSCFGWNSHDANCCRSYAETGRGATPVYSSQKEIADGVSHGVLHASSPRRGGNLPSRKLIGSPGRESTGISPLRTGSPVEAWYHPCVEMVPAEPSS
jgi:hypothetical protein